MRQRNAPVSGLTVWEINQRITPLAEWQRQHKPALTTLRVFPEDYDLITANPELAARYGFQFFGTVAMFKGLTLVRDAPRPETGPHE